MLKVYAYQGCSTCRSALKWLRSQGVPHAEAAIRETPPSLAELRAMLKARGQLRLLFNTSGQDYRALNIKDRLPAMSEAEALELLSRNGSLVKRPFAVDAEQKVFLTGFNESEWGKALA